MFFIRDGPGPMANDIKGARMPMKHRKVRTFVPVLILFVAAISVSFLVDLGGVRTSISTGWKYSSGSWDAVKPTETWTATNGTITWLVLVIGAVVGYIRFIRRRELRASCDLKLTAVIVKIAGGRAVKVEAAILNAGSCALLFPPPTVQTVKLFSADETMWEDVVVHGGEMIWDLDHDVQVQEFFPHEYPDTDKGPEVELLEPGQRYSRSWLFSIDDYAVAFRVEMYVEACVKGVLRVQGHTPWSTEAILIPEI